MAHVSLTLLVLKTRQVEQLRLFYQTLGVELVQEQHGKGPVHYAGRAGDVVIEVYPLPDDASPVDASTRLGFAVEDVAEVVRVLVGRHSHFAGRFLPNRQSDAGKLPRKMTVVVY